MSAIEALVHQQPGDGILDNTPDGAEARAVLVAARPDQRQNPIPVAAFTIVPTVVSSVGNQAADVGTDYQGAIQQMRKQLGIIDIGGPVHATRRLRAKRTVKS